MAVCSLSAAISGAEYFYTVRFPVAGEALGRERFVAPVAREQIPAPDSNLTRPALRNFLPIFIEQDHLHVFHRLPDRQGPLGERIFSGEAQLRDDAGFG